MLAYEWRVFFAKIARAQGVAAKNSENAFPKWLNRKANGILQTASQELSNERA
jgi:hypothetical protein